MIKNFSKRDSPVLPGYLKASVKHKKFSDNGSVALPSSTTTNKGESNGWEKFSSYQMKLQIPHSACKTAFDIGRLSIEKVKILRQMCTQKDAEIVEAECCTDYIQKLYQFPVTQCIGVYGIS